MIIRALLLVVDYLPDETGASAGPNIHSSCDFIRNMTAEQRLARYDKPTQLEIRHKIPTNTVDILVGFHGFRDNTKQPAGQLSGRPRIIH